MAFEKFYGQNETFFGWHCVMCGDVLDPVILLHRLSHDANISIPDSQGEIMSLIKEYMGANHSMPERKVGKSREIKVGKGDSQV